ncbi:MAG: hypothetical protein ACYDCN_01295 [Bacteroidia bacterium]
MSKVLLSVFVIFSLSVFSQRTYSDLPGKWRFGLNAGTMWEYCDVTPHAGLAGGLSIERILNRQANAHVGFSLGLRCLAGNASGMDTHPSTGVEHNDALNGVNNPNLNYAQNGGVFYNNYKTHINEGALELKLSFPRLEQNMHLILHLVGGVGICNFKTMINALDANGQLYNFSSLENNPNVTQAEVKKLENGKYTTLAQGSAANGTNMFVPSFGAGIGFKMSRNFSLVFEYRASFPRTNFLDGVNYNIYNEHTKYNDFYNYASVNVYFTIYGMKSNTVYSNPPISPSINK